MKEDLEARFKPQTFRYMKLELSGGSRKAVTVDKLHATAAVRMAAFNYGRGQNYRLFYDNPNARAVPAAPGASSINVNQVASTSSEIGLGPEQKNTVSFSPKTPQKTEKNESSRLRQILGVAMLLCGLLLLFIIMVKARSSRRSRRRRGTGPVDTTF